MSSRECPRAYHSSFSNYLRIVKAGPSQTNVPALDLLSTEQIFKKYYSKNVKKLIHTSNDKSSPLCSANRFKSLKSFIIYESSKNKCPSKQITQLKILCSGSLPRNKGTLMIIKLLAQYKHLRSLEIWANSYELPRYNLFIKGAKTFNHLRFFSLTLLEEQLVKSLKWIFCLKSLRIIKLRILPGSSTTKPKALEYYFNLIRSKNFDFLQLDLQSIVYESSLINDILQELDQTNIPSFNILLTTHQGNLINSKALSTALTHVDRLSLFGEDKVTTYFTCSKSLTNTDTDKCLDKVKRSLSLNIINIFSWKKSESKFDLQDGQVLKNLKKLFAQFWGKRFQLMPEVTSFTNLKRLSLDFTCIFPEELSAIIESLCHVLKDAKSLETLALHRMEFCYEQVEMHKFELLFTEISGLKSLKDLEIVNFIVKPSLMRIVARPLALLEDLTKFKLHILPSVPVLKTEFSIEFVERNKLLELDIKLPDMNLEAKMTFINTLARLRTLEKLSIIGGTQLFEEEEESKIILLETLQSLDKLKDISILDAQKLRYFEESELQDEESATEIRNFVEKLFEKNRGLEKVHFGRKGAYEIRYERY